MAPCLRSNSLFSFTPLRDFLSGQTYETVKIPRITTYFIRMYNRNRKNPFLLTSDTKPQLPPIAPIMDITPLLDALAYKNLVLEWADKTWLKGLYNNLDEISAVKMSLLHPELLEQASLYSSAYPAADLIANLQREKALCKREEYIAMHVKELTKPENAGMFAEVRKMLDDELATIDPAKAGLPRSLSQKVRNYTIL